MRSLMIGLGTGLLALSLAASANACGAHAVSAGAAELSAMAKKPTEEMAKKKPKEKVEYMRAVPAK